MPLYEAFCAVDRPKSTLCWLQRSGGLAIVGQMARGKIPISHEGLDQLSCTKVTDHLRAS